MGFLIFGSDNFFIRMSEYEGCGLVVDKVGFVENWFMVIFWSKIGVWWEIGLNKGFEANCLLILVLINSGHYL